MLAALPTSPSECSFEKLLTENLRQHFEAGLLKTKLLAKYDWVIRFLSLASWGGDRWRAQDEDVSDVPTSWSSAELKKHLTQEKGQGEAGVLKTQGDTLNIILGATVNCSVLV